MGIATTTAVIDHTSDAGFRAWVAEFIAQLANAGAVQTADTGQINTSTVTRPGTNTTAGYAVFRTPDSTLYYKFEFGTGVAATAPRILVTIGTGSNGTGTITGQTNTASSTMVNGAAPVSTSTAYVSRWCCKNGYIGISWKEGSVTGGGIAGILVSGVTVDGSQTITSTGFALVRLNGANLSVQSVRTAATAVTLTDQTINSSRAFSLTCIPGGESSSIDSSGNNQAYLWWINVKDVQPFLWGCTVYSAEAGVGTTFSATLIGSTAHTYVALVGVGANSPVNSATFACAMLWE